MRPMSRPSPTSRRRSARSSKAAVHEPLARGLERRRDRREIRLPGLGEALQAVPCVRHLHLCVPDLPVLRHQGLRYGPRRPALPLLGLLHVLGFTMMAHGNNRTSQMQRFPSALHAQARLFPANNDGMYSCVGCGRCVEKCPASLNIVKVIKAFERRQSINE